MTARSEEREGVCPECGAPDWDAEERECETCVAIGDLENVRGQLAEAIQYEEWGAARNELEELSRVIDRLYGALDVISDSDAHNRIVDLVNQAGGQYNAAAEQSNVDNSGLLDWLLGVEKRRGETLTVGREDMLGGAVLGLVASVDYAKQALIELATALSETGRAGT